MSFLAIPAVPYIITGTVSLLLSYKTYNNYYDNIDIMELERDNKLKNEEEKEKLNGINQDNNNSSSSSSSFISIDEEKNITVEELISPIPSPPPLEEINNKLAPIPEESEPEPELPESPALIATVEPEPELPELQESPPLITTVEPEPEPVPELPVPVLKVPIKSNNLAKKKPRKRRKKRRN